MESKVTGTAALTLGAYDLPDEPSALTNAFEGDLSHLVLFDGALTDDEVALLYESTLSGEWSGMFGRGDASVYRAIEGLQGVAGQVHEGGTPPPEVPQNEFGMGKVIYVDAAAGDDRLSGRASRVTGGHGPKKTIRSGLTAVERGGTVVVAAGVYRERVVVDGARLVTAGHVVIEE
jgi:hypothetical protein